ncbi:MAG: sugar phosphate isomerase/epimerase [Methylacidiphilales bacterium]|nr:sugar phosphate isomerase/epimerase [Candidatus Methylacidiphilales bacterium]
MSTPSSFREQLVSSPVYFPYWPLEKVLAACRDLGFHKFEGFSEWPVCKLDWRDDPATPRRLAESMGLRFTSFHLPTIREDEEVGLKNALTAAHYAAGLGAKIVLFKTISREIFGRVTKRFLDALDQTRLGLIPVVQNHKGTAISTLDDYREVFGSIGNDPRLKAVLEVGHFQRAGISWKAGWDNLGDRVALIHVNEIRNDESVLFGSGEVDFRGLIRRVKTYGYRGDIVVELELPSRESNPQETIDGVRHAVALLESYYQEA